MVKDLLWHHGDQYEGALLDPARCPADPLEAFRDWFAAAVEAGVAEANAMTLATVDPRGRPAARMVLLKELDDRGFVFFTNYESRKGDDLAHHPFAALVFFWAPMHRQVRVEGAIERVTAAESDAYFAVRPRGSQLGAIASPQSRPIASREPLVAAIEALEAAQGDAPLVRPAHWGGYRVVPDQLELWQGQRSRLHDRVRYHRVGDAWQRERLAP
jgi:pyridoxamine 5'-phosphate oxidase